MGQALPGSSVLGAWAGENAAESVQGCGEAAPNPAQMEKLAGKVLAPLEREKGLGYHEVHAKIGRLISDVVDHVLVGKNLAGALEAARAIKKEELPRLAAKDPHELAKVNGLKNFVEAFEPALMVLLRRQESRGNVLREDYPEIDNIKWAKFTVCRKEGEEVIKIWEEPIPEDEDHLPVQRVKVLHPFFAE
jgi:succinate dehydrogenase/fumarate reductase flavoprotein subunit